jgi:hypothetical protein
MVVDVYCLLHAVMNATKLFTRQAAAAAVPVGEDEDEEGEEEEGEPALRDDDDDAVRTYADMRSVFHWLAKAIRNSRLRREVFTNTQTKPVAEGGAGQPAQAIGAALEHKFVADDVELGSMLKCADVFRLLSENELDNPAFGYHGTQGGGGKKSKFRNAVKQFLADVPILKLI